MKNLTQREEEIMQLFWSQGALFVKDLLEHHSDPKPHFNTLSTIVRGLEDKKYLSHNTYGNTHQYYPIITKEEYNNSQLTGVVSKYFNNSFLDVVSTLVKEEELSIEELKKLIEQVEQQEK